MLNHNEDHQDLTRSVDVLINNFGHLPSAEELLEKPGRSVDFMKAVSELANKDEYASRTFEPPHSLADFPKEVATNYSYSTHNEVTTIRHSILVDHLRSNGSSKLVCVRFGSKGADGNALRHAQFEGIQRVLQDGFPLDAADILHKDVHPSMEQPIDKLLKLFPEITFRTFVGGLIIPKGREADLIEYPGVFWTNKSGELTLSIADPAIY